MYNVLCNVFWGLSMNYSYDAHYLQKIATQIRKDILTMIYECGDGHPAPSLSIVEMLVSLYFVVMKIDPKNPDYPERDRFILSKGHACPALYSVLARKGFFSVGELPTLRTLHSNLQGHPYQRKTKGLDATTGSLGHGISLGIGMALASYYLNTPYFTYVIIGDGEQEEGLIWEAAITAAKYKIGRLIVFVDCNGLQSGGFVNEISALYPLETKWQAFGWHCQSIDGHNFDQIISAIECAQSVDNAPSIIFGKTIKGKGISFIENNNDWHKKVPKKEELEQALNELGDLI